MIDKDKSKLDSEPVNSSDVKTSKESTETKSNDGHEEETIREISDMSAEKDNILNSSEAIPKNKRPKKILLFSMFFLIIVLLITTSIIYFRNEISEKFFLFTAFVNESIIQDKDNTSQAKGSISKSNSDSLAELSLEQEPALEAKPAPEEEPALEAKSSLETELTPEAKLGNELMVDIESEKQPFSVGSNLKNNSQSNERNLGIKNYDINTIDSQTLEPQKIINRKKYIQTLEELNLKINQLSFNFMPDKFEASSESYQRDAASSSELITSILGMVRITKIETQDKGLHTKDFYLIIREQLKMRLLSSKLMIASQFDLNPIADLNEASLLLDKYFLKDRVFLEIRGSLDKLIKTFNEDNTSDIYSGD